MEITIKMSISKYIPTIFIGRRRVKCINFYINIEIDLIFNFIRIMVETYTCSYPCHIIYVSTSCTTGIHMI